jgi:hypothetical protein
MNLVEVFESLNYAQLQDFVERGQEEHLHLDFKLLNDASLSGKEDRKNFACSLSGFANSGGGLIIWGVDARKNSDGIDCAVDLKPISQVALLIARLNSLTGECVDPSVAGVRRRAIELKDGSGFAATLVPESDTGPHMAKLGENRYYKRIGDGFYRMEHYDIADMFGRRRKPKLCVFYRVTGMFSQAQVHLGIRNDGRATARAPFFAFDSDGPLQRSHYGLDGNCNEGLTRLRAVSSGLQWAYGGGMDFALHPAMEHEVACLALGIPSRPEPTRDVVVRYALACEDQPIERGTLIIPLAELC